MGEEQIVVTWQKTFWHKEEGDCEDYGDTFRETIEELESFLAGLPGDHYRIMVETVR